MKLTKKFVTWFFIFFFAVLILNYLNEIDFSDKATVRANSFVDNKLTGAQYPLAVFSLLLISSILELFLLFGLNPKLMEKLKEKSMGWVVGIAGTLLGGLMSLTALTYFRGNIDEAKLGISVAFMIILYVAAPIFMVSVLFMLREADSNPKRMQLIKFSAALTYVLIALISIWGLYKTQFPQ